ncbi:hypothetical protein [Salinimicrobium sp. HB62]|uniref:hypothetical protein n=1 Tax=Salinimicrobium sp. HB62 TaxID=3077781 RepID=UPI002D78B06C|nr:hypothetical protein [Salinimicrobium sp. HB62]
MLIKTLNIDKDKAKPVVIEFNSLLDNLRERDLSEATINTINGKIERLNSLPPDSNLQHKKIRAAKNDILKHLEKEYRLVSQHYYTSLGLPLGMTAIGIPIGVVIYLLTGNIAFIAIGLPVGMAIGSFFGASLDKRAEKEGRVLNFIEK